MNNKGFTLAELLAIIVILAVIMIIAAPNLTKQINKREEMDTNILNQKIENASKIYVAKYYSDKVIEGSGKISFTLNDLQQDGLINLTKNNKCSNFLEKYIIVTISNSSEINYDYNGINGCYKN